VRKCVCRGWLAVLRLVWGGRSTGRTCRGQRHASTGRPPLRWTFATKCLSSFLLMITQVMKKLCRLMVWLLASVQLAPPHLSWLSWPPAEETTNCVIIRTFIVSHCYVNSRPAFTSCSFTQCCLHQSSSGEPGEWCHPILYPFRVAV